MNIESDKNIARTNRPGPYSAVLLRVQRIVRWLIWLFTLTEEDRLAAGIYFGDDGRE